MLRGTKTVSMIALAMEEGQMLKVREEWHGSVNAFLMDEQPPTIHSHLAWWRV
jgi:hypothetical protein